MIAHRRSAGSLVVALTFVLFAVTGSAASAAAAGPDGQLTWGVHFSLAPTWLDPAETPAMITPFLTLYAVHDAVAKPMPGNPMAPSLAESWAVSKDGLSYEFVLRKNVRFHNGVGPRVEESGLGLIPGHAYSAPYEDLKLRGR